MIGGPVLSDQRMLYRKLRKPTEAPSNPFTSSCTSWEQIRISQSASHSFTRQGHICMIFSDNMGDIYPFMLSEPDARWAILKSRGR
jgi:hypothetical protein